MKKGGKSLGSGVKGVIKMQDSGESIVLSSLLLPIRSIYAAVKLH